MSHPYGPPAVSDTPKQPWWLSGWLIAVLIVPIITIPLAWVLTARRKDWPTRRRWLTVGGTAALLVVVVAVSPGKHSGSTPSQNTAAAVQTSASTSAPAAPATTSTSTQASADAVAPDTTAASTTTTSAPSAPAPTSASSARSSAPASALHPATKPTTSTKTVEPAKPSTSASAPASEHPTSSAPAAGGSCAPHTVAVCGWDVGVAPNEPGETATCKDGTDSFSATFSGTCSHHGGVEYWYK